MKTSQITIRDVVLRDGLQDEPVLVPVSDRLAIANALVAAGLRHIEVASFVNPGRVPQMAGAAELVARLPRDVSVHYHVLALHGRGIRQAISAGARQITVVASASPEHSRANAGRDVDAALADLAAAVTAHPEVQFTAGISTAFVCPFNGEIAPSELLAVARRFTDMGIGRIVLADTLGTASAAQVLRSLDTVRSTLPGVLFGLHLHNAHGQALSTVDAAIAAGINDFDSAAGGYGGCPFAPGAGPNVATEDLVAHLHARGIATGIDESALADAVVVIKRSLGRATPLSARSINEMS